MMDVYFIYSGKRLNGTKISHEYRIMSLLEHNDGRSAKEFRTFNTEKNIFPNGAFGSIRKVSLTTDSQVSYNKNAIIHGYWKNKQDMIEWRTESLTAESYEHLKKNPGIGNVEEILEPLRTSYKHSTRIEQRLIIAEIIRIITS